MPTQGKHIRDGSSLILCPFGSNRRFSLLAINIEIYVVHTKGTLVVGLMSPDFISIYFVIDIVRDFRRVQFFMFYGSANKVQQCCRAPKRAARVAKDFCFEISQRSMQISNIDFQSKDILPEFLSSIKLIAALDCVISEII